MDFVAFVVTAANVCYNPCGAGVVLRARVCWLWGVYFTGVLEGESVGWGLSVYCVYSAWGVSRA